MADDTRERDSKSSQKPPEVANSSAHPPPDPSNSTATPPPPTQSPKIYEGIAPPPNANVLPGGTANTAGGAAEDASLGKALGSIKVEDFKKVHHQPCVRDSLLTGMASGFGVGGLRAIFGAPIPKASNWAVGTFCTASFVAYEFCQYKRQLEMEGMKRAVEIIDRKKLEKEEQAKEAARKAKENEQSQTAEQAKRNSSWKFW